MDKQAFDQLLDRTDGHFKTAMPRQLHRVPTGAGPEQMYHALSMLGQARALVNPSDELLASKGVGRPAFERHLATIADHSAGQDRFDLKAIAPNPKLHAGVAGAIGGLGTAAVLGKAHSIPAGLLGGLGVGGISALIASERAKQQRRDIGGTAKVLKEYGILNPELLQQARPLLLAN